MRRTWAWLGAAAALVVTLVLGWGLNLQSPPAVFRLAGRLHPLIVHFPVGLLLLALLFRLLGRRPGRSIHLKESAGLIWDLGTLSAIAVALTGLALALEGGFAPELIFWHKRLGIAVAVTGTGAALLSRLPGVRTDSGRWKFLHGLLVGLTALFLIGAGHLGGTMVHGAGYWSAYLPASIGRLVDPFSPEFGRDETSPDFHELRIFPDLVRPLLETHCVSCHGPTRQQGGLRLDSHRTLLAGGHRGPVVTPGHPDESDLLRRVSAPILDPDRMPPAGQVPLSVGETELLRWWISEGASSELRVVEATTLPSSIDTLLNQQFGYRTPVPAGIFALEVTPAPSEAIQAAEKAGFRVKRLSADYDFLRVQAGQPGAWCVDETLQILQPLAAQIAWLNLAGTAIGDAGLAAVARMPHLTRLDLSRTRVGDEGLAHLKTLQYLESLNLYATKVSDSGLEHLREMPALSRLYLWQSAVTLDGVETFRKESPTVEVTAGLQLQGFEGQQQK